MYKEFTGPSSIQGREIFDLTLMAPSFLQAGFQVNPAYESIFPLLSADAQRFSEYRFKRLHCVYAPNSSTVRDGLVAMAWEPDAGRTASPNSILEIEQHDVNVHGPVYEPKCLVMPPSGWKRVLAPPTIAALQPPNEYSHGLLQLGTQGGADGTDTIAVGQYSIEYEIEFRHTSTYDGALSIDQQFVTSTPASTNLLAGTVQVADSDGTFFNPLPVGLSTTRSVLIPTTPFEGRMIVEVSGTGFDTSTVINANTVNGQFVAVSPVTDTQTLSAATNTTYRSRAFDVASLPAIGRYVSGTVTLDTDGITLALIGASAAVITTTVTFLRKHVAVPWPSWPAAISSHVDGARLHKLAQDSTRRGKPLHPELRATLLQISYRSAFKKTPVDLATEVRNLLAARKEESALATILGDVLQGGWVPVTKGK